MPQTLVVIAYSPGQGLRRVVVLPDDDSQVPVHTRNLAPGEQVMVGSLSDYRTMGPDAMLARYLGRKKTSDRCAVVAAGVVVGLVAMDPAIDRVAGGHLHRDPNGVCVVGQPVPATRMPLLP